VTFPKLLPHYHHGGLVGGETYDPEKIYNVEVILCDDAVSDKTRDKDRHSSHKLLVA
jgi:hypothetical protein